MQTSQIPQNFYEVEVREGCEISEYTKRVWAREIELYFEFDRVCKKHNLTYYIAYGSLLGAVRHGGFIPWDDDLDVLMMREDYDALCKIAPEEFKEPFFFQNEHTDKGCRLAFTKLRNSNTCGMTPFEKLHDFRYNQGMFFDIFPLDNVSNDPEEQKAMIAESMKLQKQATNWSRYFDSKKLYFGRKWLYALAPAVWAAKAVEKLFGIKPLFMGPGVRTGLDIKIERPAELGADIAAACVGALSLQKPPFVVVGLGDATTLTLIDRNSRLLGVMICPGAFAGIHGLSRLAAELPVISLEPPRGLLGRNTVDSMNNGAVYGTAAMVEGLVDRLRQGAGEEDLPVIATGTLCDIILPYCRVQAQQEPDLVLQGLKKVYELNKK